MYNLNTVVLFVAQLICLLQARPNVIMPVMPDACKNMEYCKEIDYHDYPQAEIDAILSDMPLKYVEVKETQRRYSKDTDSGPCKGKTYGGPIHYIVDADGITRYVVQNNDFTQSYRVTKCEKPGRLEYPMNPLIRTNLDICKYDVKCVEELVPVPFLVLTLDRTGVEVVKMKDGLPMACTCKYSVPVQEDQYNCTDAIEKDQMRPEELREEDDF